MASSSVLIAVPKSVWSRFKPAADRRGVLPSRLMLDLLRHVAEDELVEAVLDDQEPDDTDTAQVAEVAPAEIAIPADDVPSDGLLHTVAAEPELPAPARPDPASLVRALISELGEDTPRPVLARSSRGPVLRGMEKQVAIPDIPFHLRKTNLDAAIAVLKRRCILVDAADRGAAVRKYRVSGYREDKLAEEVIEIAMQHGFEVIDG